MDYWIDEFTEETWDQFWEAGGRISGWPDHYRNKVDDQVAQGDILVCYIIGKQKWVGALKVLGTSDDKSPIWGLDEEGRVKYPARLRVKPLVGLDVDLAIPMDELERKVSFFKSSTDKGTYRGFVRSSLKRFGDSADGKHLLRLLLSPRYRLDGRRWAADELQPIVDDYFAMLEAEIDGEPYDEIEHRRLLKAKLKGRNEDSIEFEYQNISGILRELGRSRIKAYKPRSSHQKLLTDQVMEFLSISNPAQVGRGRTASPIQAVAPGSYESAESEPPKPSRALGHGIDASRWHLKTDFARRDENNRALGDAGEDLVVQWEKQRLTYWGHTDLVESVKRVSLENDSAGYDIVSFGKDRKQLFIEVKTTTGNANRPFFLTRNEVNRSDEKGDQYRLYRVYDLKKKPRYYVLSGPLGSAVKLEPETYTALPKADGDEKK